MPSPKPMQARAARPEEAESVLRVICAAFGLDADEARPLFYQDPFFDLSHKRVLVAPSGEIVSCLTVIPSALRIGPVLVPTAGIAGVATVPAAQRCGYASALLSATVGDLAGELGYAVAALFPYSYSFYRRFGWETASRTMQWTGPAASLPRYAEAARVRLPRPTGELEQVAVHALHEIAVAGRTSAFRDARRWRIIQEMTPNRETAVYEGRTGAIEGYLLFDRRAGSDGAATLVIQEMYGVNAAARRGLIGFLAASATEPLMLEWHAAPEDLASFGLLSLPDLETHTPRVIVRAGMMLRLTDLPAALAQVHLALYAPALAESGRTLTLRAEDPLCPQNARPVRLRDTGVEPGASGDPDWLAAPVQVLAQLFLGYQMPSEAASMGRLSTSSPEALALADRLFPARQPFVAPADQF